MFAPYPPTPQVLEAKAELRSMMEDAYTGARAAGRSRNEALGQAISEFGNLQEVAPLLGLHQEEQEEAMSNSSEPASPTSTSRPKVSLAQAANYAAVLDHLAHSRRSIRRRGSDRWSHLPLRTELSGPHLN